MMISTNTPYARTSLHQLIGPVLTLGLIVAVEILDRRYGMEDAELLLVVATVVSGYVCGRTSGLLSALMSCLYVTFRVFIDDPIGQPLSMGLALVTIALSGLLLRRDAPAAPAAVIRERDPALYDAYLQAQEQADRYLSIVKLAPDAIVVTDSDLRITVFNRGAEQLFGYPAGAITGEPLSLLFAADVQFDSAATRVEVERPHLQDEALSYIELQCLRKDGSGFPAEVGLHEIFDGKQSLLALTLRDISKRKAIELALQQQQDHFHKLLDYSPEGVCIIESDIITYANQAFADMRGAGSASNLIGAPVSTQFDASSRQSLQRCLANIAETRVSALMEEKLLHTDGHPVHVEIAVAPCGSADGRNIQILVRDIGVRKLAEESLRDSDTRFRELAANIHDIFWIANAECNEIYYLSPAFESIWGHSCLSAYKNEFSFADSIHPEDKNRALVFTMDARQGEPRACEYRIVRPDGTVRWIQDRRFPIKDSEGTVRRVAGIAQDITERRQAEEQIQKFNDELEQRNKEAILLNELSGVLQSCLSLDEAYTAIPQTCQKLFPSFAGSLSVVHGTHNYLESVADWGDPMLTDQIFEPRACWALRRGQWHCHDRSRPSVLCQHVQTSGKHDPIYLCVPLMAQSEVLGLLYLELHDNAETSGAQTISERDTRLAVTFADQVAMALANIRLRETLRNQSIRDPVSGLYNRRYFEEALLREIARAERREMTVSVIMLDIDNFKFVTDEFGHQGGDRVLSELATTLLAHTRISDSACHYGGAEFVLLLPDTPTEPAMARAEHLRAAISDLAIKLEDGTVCRVTVSIGIATYPRDGRQPEALVRAADRALYMAKHSRSLTSDKTLNSLLT